MQALFISLVLCFQLVLFQELLHRHSGMNAASLQCSSSLYTSPLKATMCNCINQAASCGIHTTFLIQLIKCSLQKVHRNAAVHPLIILGLYRNAAGARFQTGSAYFVVTVQ